MRRLDDKSPFDQVIADMALVDCHPRHLDPGVVLNALLHQDGHYVASEVVDLMGLAGVAPRSGYALVMRTGSWDPAVCSALDGVVRSNGEYDVLFFEDYLGHHTPPSPIVTEADMRALERACERWGQPSEWEPKLFFLWGVSSPDPARMDAYRKYVLDINNGELPPGWTPETPAEQHARLIREGYGGTVALAAGRIGEPVLHISGARWMFDIEGNPNA